uniref:Uncharacterized protein n=1 Tax=Triticum urartu TaxID=4572 RepID=A0A8R7QX86_TRIUA
MSSRSRSATAPTATRRQTNQARRCTTCGYTLPLSWPPFCFLPSLGSAAVAVTRDLEGIS